MQTADGHSFTPFPASIFSTLLVQVGRNTTDESTHLGSSVTLQFQTFVSNTDTSVSGLQS